MAFTFSGIAADVTIDGGIAVDSYAPISSSTQTIVNESGIGDGNINTIYTVPANKILYAFCLIGERDAECLLYKTDGSTIVARSNSEGGAATTIVQPSCPIWSYAAAETVKLKQTNAYKYVFIGVLDDA